MTRIGPVITNAPMIARRRLASIRMIMTGTATTPLTTALQYSAFIGLIGAIQRHAHRSVATAIVP